MVEGNRIASNTHKTNKVDKEFLMGRLAVLESLQVTASPLPHTPSFFTHHCILTPPSPLLHTQSTQTHRTRTSGWLPQWRNSRYTQKLTSHLFEKDSTFTQHSKPRATHHAHMNTDTPDPLVKPSPFFPSSLLPSFPQSPPTHSSDTFLTIMRYLTKRYAFIADSDLRYITRQR